MPGRHRRAAGASGCWTTSPVDARWCLIHATHMTAGEIAGAGRSGAVAGLCPTTEASLGDGVFPLPRFLAAGGRFGIGTDSHVGTAPRDELRQLETGQRLRGTPAPWRRPRPRRIPGGALLDAALAGGAQAMRPAARGASRPGCAATWWSWTPSTPRWSAMPGIRLLDAWVFSGQAQPHPHRRRRRPGGGGGAGGMSRAWRSREDFAATMRRLLA